MTASQNYEKLKIFLNCEHDLRECDYSTLSKIPVERAKEGCRDRKPCGFQREAMHASSIVACGNLKLNLIAFPEKFNKWRGRDHHA
jgi:hypothetical protein